MASSSLFDLPTDASNLSSTNLSCSRMQYDQHPPTRDVTGANFPNGALHFRFQTSGQRRWIPSRSYIRTRFELLKGDGTPITVATEIAPNMGLMSNLFQSGEVRINDKVVSRISDFFPQIDALETRLSKSKPWLDTIGASTNFWQADQTIRMNEVSDDGTLIKNKIAGDQTVQVGRLAMGYAAQNTVEYTAATGTLTFAAGGGAAPPDARVVYPVGTYFEFLAGDARNIRMKVVRHIDALNMIVEGLYNDDIAAGATNFQRVTINRAVNAASRRVGSFELTWTPPLSLFKVEKALPSGRYELVLNPQTSTSYQRRAIESVLGAASKEPLLPGQAPDPAKFQLRIVDMYLYCATVEGPRADNITYYLDLESTRLQTDKIDTTSFAQKNFDVSPSTTALTVAYQDLRAGENTALSPSKFRSYENVAQPFSPQELSLNRFYINFAGENKPSPDADPSFTAGKDYTIQRYFETQIHNGAYHDASGGENVEEFHDRGAYYHFQWPRDGTDRSTRVQVNSQFDPAANVTNMRVLLFDHFRQVCRVQVVDGAVVSVELEDA